MILVYDNLARTLELPLLVRFVGICLNRGLKESLFAVSYLLNPKGEILDVLG